MIVRLKVAQPDYPDLSEDQPYFVIGIEAGDYRILNDAGLDPGSGSAAGTIRDPWFHTFGRE